MKLGDIIVIIIVIIVAGILLIIPLTSDSDNLSAKIICGANEQYMNLSHDTEMELANNGYHLTIVIVDETIQVIESDCPDGTCKTMGIINNAGQFIACVPAGVYIEIISEGSYSDGIAG